MKAVTDMRRQTREPSSAFVVYSNIVKTRYLLRRPTLPNVGTATHTLEVVSY